jgi:hypothetical protein
MKLEQLQLNFIRKFIVYLLLKYFSVTYSSMNVCKFKILISPFLLMFYHTSEAWCCLVHQHVCKFRILYFCGDTDSNHLRGAVLVNMLLAIQLDSKLQYFIYQTNISLMKQQFYRRQKKLDQSSIDQRVSTLCFYENVRTRNFFVDTTFWQVCL